jgi:chromosome segregation ATPase
MRCFQCDTNFDPHQFDQNFCSAACSNRHHQKLYRQRAKSRKARLQSTVIQASSEIEQLKENNERLQEENEKLKEQNEQWKTSIIKHNERIGRLEEIIDKRDDTIKVRDQEIERLKLEKRLFNQTSVRNAATLTREHLERVLHSEIRRQFPSDTHIQEHIVAIRSFNASYINALVTA